MMLLTSCWNHFLALHKGLLLPVYLKPLQPCLISGSRDSA